MPGYNHMCTHPCGYIASPNFPLNYDPYSDIYWDIKIQSGQYIKLNFTQMKVESSFPDCGQDKVIITDYRMNGEPKILGMHCVLSNLDYLN